MPYERVLRVNDGLIQNINGQRYVRKDDAGVLAKGEEGAVLYFVRHSSYTVLHDFPVRGDFKRVSPHSIIEGPLEQAPQISEGSSDEKIMDVEMRVIPAGKIPSAFTPIEVLEYGTARGDQRRKYIDHLYGAESMNKLPLEKIAQIGEEALKNLQRITSPRLIEVPPRPPGHVTDLRLALLASYIAEAERTSIELTISRGNQYRFYPTAYLRVFGEAETTSRWIKELGLDRLNEIFKMKDAREVGLENSLRKGLAATFIDISKGFPNIDGDEGIIL